MPGPPSRRRAILALAAILTLLFWDLPLLLPLRILVVVFHEAGHALTALFTGGQVLGITVSPSEGGRTVTSGGIHFLVLNGGYLGSLLFGLLLLWSARVDGRGRAVLGLLSLFLGLSALAWFRPILSFGFVYALLTAGVLGALAAKARPVVSDWIVRFVGLFSVLYAALDVRADVLSHGLLAGTVPSDAAMLAQMTHIPALVWGLGWMLVGGVLVWRLRDRVF